MYSAAKAYEIVTVRMPYFKISTTQEISKKWKKNWLNSIFSEKKQIVSKNEAAACGSKYTF